MTTKITAGCLLVAAGCSSSSANQANPTELTDTTGATFTWTCTKQGCGIAPNGATPPASACGLLGAPPEYNYWLSRLFTVCLGSSGSANPYYCRAIVCSHDSDCPEWEGIHYGCHAGLCERLDLSLDGSDVLTLCLATLPVVGHCDPTRDDPQLNAAIQEAHSGCAADAGVCTVPAQCRQP